MSGRGYRATIALALALFASMVLMPAAASAGEYRDQPSMSAVNQQQALLYLLTMLTVAKFVSTSVATAADTIGGPILREYLTAVSPGARRKYQLTV